MATFSCPGNTLCWVSSESEALAGFYTARLVRPNLALLSAQYSFEVEGTLDSRTLGAQDPLSFLTRWTPHKSHKLKHYSTIASLGKQHLVC